MSRRNLPSRRHSTTQKATVGGVRTYLTVGHYEDNTPGEIFLSVEGVPGEVRLLYDVIARLASMALQYGMPLDKLIDMLIGIKGEVRGPVRYHNRIKMSSSILDYVARDLGIQYLNREDLAHVK